MSTLLAGLLGALLATNQPLAVSNLVAHRTGLSLPVVDANDPVEKEYQKLLAEDDAAQAEIDRWIQDNEKFKAEGAGLGDVVLRPRIKQRLELVRQAYESFLERHPNHARARIAYGSFLGDIGEEQTGAAQWEKAIEIDPRQPAAYNNLANYYGHNGPVKKVFEYYEKAIALAPQQSLYYQNLATAVYAFRKDAQEYYDIGLPQIFNKAMALYHKALALDPQNFPLATELAQTYYGFKPPPSDDPAETRRAEQKHYDQALEAWQVALKLARDEIEREGVYIHIARVNIMAGRLDEAHHTLNLITNSMYDVVRARLEKRFQPGDTNVLSAPPIMLRPLSQ